MPTKTWAQGEDVLAADFNTYVQKQVVSVFADATARDAAITAPTAGMACFLTGTGEFQIYRVGIWRPPAGTLVYSNMITMSDVSLGAVQLVDITPSMAQSLTFPYPTQVHGTSVLYAGYGGGTVNLMSDIWSFSSNSVIVTAPQPIQAIGAAWTPLSLDYLQAVTANTAVGFKCRISLLAGSNLHTSGYLSIKVYAA